MRCAGTNFLTRAEAFRQGGWSPEYTLTEDYALGMELMMRKWKCRYVEEYLAVGEAPSQLRNCFQQRSRWAKVLRPVQALGVYALAACFRSSLQVVHASTAARVDDEYLLYSSFVSGCSAVLDDFGVSA